MPVPWLTCFSLFYLVQLFNRVQHCDQLIFWVKLFNVVQHRADPQTQIFPHFLLSPLSKREANKGRYGLTSNIKAFVQAELNMTNSVKIFDIQIFQMHFPLYVLCIWKSGLEINFNPQFLICRASVLLVTKKTWIKSPLFFWIFI